MKFFTIVFVLLLANMSHAGWSASGTVSAVTSHNGFHLIATDIADGMCGQMGKFYWRTDDPDAKDMFSIALAAFISAKSIAVVYNSESAECILTNFTQASHISIKN